MNKNPSERKTMPGNQRGDMDRDVQEKEGQQGQRKDQKSQGQHEEHNQQKHHRQGEPMGQQKPVDPNKQRKQDDTDAEDTGPGERKRA